jgi:uncharacterized protein
VAVGFSPSAVTTFGGENWFLIDRYLLPPLVALGLLGLVTTVMLRSREVPGPDATPARLGLAARFADARPWCVVGLWAAVCAVLMVAASLWLRRFDRGPLELLAHRVQGIGRAPARAGNG